MYIRTNSYKMSRSTRLMRIVYEPSASWGRTISMENIRFTDYEDESMQNLKPFKRGGKS